MSKDVFINFFDVKPFKEIVVKKKSNEKEKIEEERRDKVR
jgi:hypothetical protein